MRKENHISQLAEKEEKKTTKAYTLKMNTRRVTRSRSAQSIQTQGQGGQAPLRVQEKRDRIEVIKLNTELKPDNYRVWADRCKRTFTH